MNPETLINGVEKIVNARLGPIRKAMTQVSDAVFAIDNRLKNIEQKLSSESEQMRYRGMWQAAIQYKAGDVVTHEDTLWHCSVDAEKGVRPRRGDAWAKMFNPKANDR